jgi:hypothetical protein
VNADPSVVKPNMDHVYESEREEYRADVPDLDGGVV